MAMSNGGWCILALSAAIATFAIRSQSQQVPPTASQMAQQTSYSSSPGTPKWNRATPDSSFQFVTAAQQEDGNPNAGSSVMVYPTNARASQPGMPQPNSVAPQDWNQNQPENQDQAVDENGNTADMPSYDDAAATEPQVTTQVNPDINLNLNTDRQAANPYEFTDQELMDRFMATMTSNERNGFSMVWLTMSPEEQSSFMQQFRSPN